MAALSPIPVGIELCDLRLSFDGAPLMDAFGLTVPEGQFVCLLGASGTGKSTLLRTIAGLVKPDRGSVAASGPVALMTQDDALLPWARPVSNVTLGGRLRGEAADVQRAEALLAAVGLAGVTGRPDTLSGGMRKRVALARLLYEARPIVLLDEPFSALDAITRREVQALTLQLLRKRTVVLVTHDPFEAIALADRIAVIAGRPARLVLDVALPVSADNVLRDPGNPEHFPIYRRVLDAIGSSAT